MTASVRVKIYTKIFIGMACGIAAGLAAGPRSPWLARDLLTVSDPAQIELLDAPGGARLDAQLPRIDGAMQSLRATIHARQHAERQLYYRVEISITRHMAAADPSGRLKVGQRLHGWVRAEGLPQPVNAIGERIAALLRPVGAAFLRLIKMVIVPLVFASLLVGVASLGDPKRLGRLGGKTIGYFLVTTALAITIGLAVANVVKPGRYVSAENRANLVAQYKSAAANRSTRVAEQPSAVDTLVGIIPENPVASLADGAMLPTIFFAMLFGVVLTTINQDKATMVIALFEAINDAMVKIVDLVMKLAPYGVFALVAQVIGESGIGVLGGLLAYVLVVIVGLALHSLAVYTSVVRLVGRLPVGDFWRAIRPAQLIAFSTCSSMATLPVTMECAEKNLGISNRIAAFVLPIGGTVNMDGTALYQGVAAVFIAQVFNIHLTLADQARIVLMATMASIGTASVPGVGMITLALVLTSIGVPTVGLALIMGTDRILDMFRTAVNVTGDLSAAVLVAASEGETLRYRQPVADTVADTR